MKKYRVNVNGTVYEVEVEEIKAGDTPVQVKETPAPVAAPAPTAGGEQITSPMPGNILDVRVNTGDSVNKGDVLMILEAMKMENEIMCPKDGRISQIAVNKGATVETGTLLCVIE